MRHRSCDDDGDRAAGSASDRMEIAKRERPGVLKTGCTNATRGNAPGLATDSCPKESAPRCLGSGANRPGSGVGAVAPKKPKRDMKAKWTEFGTRPAARRRLQSRPGQAWSRAPSAVAASTFGAGKDVGGRGCGAVVVCQACTQNPVRSHREATAPRGERDEDREVG